jgi:uncharacterized protein YjbI with pentapeptide repeats
MNDAADEPSKPPSADPKLRTISDEELERILQDHLRWLEAKDKTDLEPLRADLSRAQLKGADLIAATLREANLTEAQLQEAILIGAQLQRADLRRAHLQRANMLQANLNGAVLYAAQLEDAELLYATLQGANLDEAQLQGASLINADFHGAYLRSAILGPGSAKAELQKRGASLATGGTGQERSADLTDADFRDADLSNAQLSTVTGLRAEMLAGAVLTNAKLPDDVKTFDQLKHVEETSRNAITVFFGLLAASLYSWLTIATTTDVALITGTASSPLPIINTNIALSGFYLAAPLILLAVYFYFHLYLQRLWSDLASLPAVFPDGVELDRKAYPWLLNGLVRKHFKKLELAQRPLTRVENFISIFLAWWAVPFTLLAFWLRFLPRHDWLGTTLHVSLIAGAAWFGVYSYRLAVRTLSGGATATQEEKGGDQRLRVRIWRAFRRYLPSGMEAASAGLAIVVVLSAGVWIDPGDPPPIWRRLPLPPSDLLTILRYETYADLRHDDVSTKPAGWTGQEEIEEVEIGQVKGADLEGRDLRNANASGAFFVRANLAGANLRESDLFNADLRGADLTSADLRGATLAGADFRGADLTSADFRGAFMQGVDLRGAATWQTDQTDLRGANMLGANLRGATLWQTDLRNATFGGADLRGATLWQTDLRNANLTAANLSYADLRAALFLTQTQLDKACGDDKTQLPAGLTIKTCPDTAPSAPPTGSS